MRTPQAAACAHRDAATVHLKVEPEVADDGTELEIELTWRPEARLSRGHRRTPLSPRGHAANLQSMTARTSPDWPATVPEDMRRIPGGSFLMGSEDFYPEERPVRRVEVSGFWIDERPVTVAQFRRFVKATGYVTVAERPLDPAEFPGADPGRLVPGSLVFRRTRGPVDLGNFRNWWAYVPGACWSRPEGPASDTYTRGRHPVTQVAYEDAEAFADWVGKALPTEAEWEYAARGGLEGATYAWGDEPFPDGRPMANTWQGEFPWQNLLADGYEGTSPVGAFPPNGFGLLDMIGNVWEWTRDPFGGSATGACCGPAPDDGLARRVIKGGSHLCAPGYCLRYRPAARQAESVDTSTSHIGFRCVVRGEQAPARSGRSSTDRPLVLRTIAESVRPEPTRPTASRLGRRRSASGPPRSMRAG